MDEQRRLLQRKRFLAALAECDRAHTTKQVEHAAASLQREPPVAESSQQLTLPLSPPKPAS